MNLVVDASVVTKWFIKEESFEQAEALLGMGELLFAPELVLVELANVLWKKVRRGEIGTEQAEDIVRELGTGVPELFSVQPLLSRALGIAIELGHPVYDCTYLACAEAVDGIVVTADRRLLNTLQGSSLSGLARHISELPSPP